MITVKDFLNLKLDGVNLIAGESGLDKKISWSYLVQTRPFVDHMNKGNFAILVVDFNRYDLKEATKAFEELIELGISGMAISIEGDVKPVPKKMINIANEKEVPLFYVRWEGANFVDIDQSLGEIIFRDKLQSKRTGDYLYNLLFGYDINDRYVDKISSQLELDFSKPHRVGIIVVDRKYGVNLEQDEHIYEFYGNILNAEVLGMEGHPMFMRFLNKFVLLFEAREDKAIERELEKILRKIDESPQFKGLIRGTCILGAAYSHPKDFTKSYNEAKLLIAKKDLLPHARDKKVLSATAMGIYKYLFNSGNKEEVLAYCNEKLEKLEEYDHANGTFLVDTVVSFYMNGFNVTKTAEELFIHRNSLQYRIEKIEELVGFKMEDKTEYLDLINCILTKRLMFL